MRMGCFQRRFNELKTFVADFFGTARGDFFNRDEGMDVHLYNTRMRWPKDMRWVWKKVEILGKGQR